MSLFVFQLQAYSFQKSLILHKILQSNVKVLSAAGRLVKVYGFKIQINMPKSEIKDKTNFYHFLIQHSRTVQALYTALMLGFAFEAVLGNLVTLS